MHKLAITIGDTTHTVSSSDFEHARRTLTSYVVANDLYLDAKLGGPCEATAFQLVSIDETTRKPRPRVVGTATIAPAADRDVAPADYSATELRCTEKPSVQGRAEDNFCAVTSSSDGVTAQSAATTPKPAPALVVAVQQHRATHHPQ